METIPDSEDSTIVNISMVRIECHGKKNCMVHEFIFSDFIFYFSQT